MTSAHDAAFYKQGAALSGDEAACSWGGVTDLESTPGNPPPCDGAATSDHRVLPRDTPSLDALFAVAREELGRGEFGVVRACMQRTTGRLLACKSIDKAALMASGRMEDLAMEVLCMRVMPRHPHMVRLASMHEDSQHVHLVMDLCQGGDLFDLIAKAGRLAPDFAAHIFRQAASAVAFCHAHGVLHLDIKPENLLLHTRLPLHYLAAATPTTSAASDSRDSPASRRAVRESVCVKLADFGQAVRLLPGQMACGMAGSSFYMAPEVVCGRPYDTAADVWSLGVLLYVMLAGYVPFWGTDLPSTFQAICTTRPSFSAHPWPSVSPLCIHLIRAMLSVDPRRRPTLQQVLAHPWIRVALGETDHRDGAAGVLATAAAAAAASDDDVGDGKDDEEDSGLPSLVTACGDDNDTSCCSLSGSSSPVYAGADVDGYSMAGWSKLEGEDYAGSVGEGRNSRRRGEEGGGRRKRGCRERRG